MPNNRISYFECTYGLVDVDAQRHAQFACSTTQKSQLDALAEGRPSYNMMTLEHNYTTLDKTYSEIPTTSTFEGEEQFALFTSDMSDGNGDFSTDQILTVTFSDNSHSFYGPTFEFENDYPTEVQISYTNTQSATITRTFAITSKSCFVDMEVDDCVSMTVKFVKTLPCRYIKLNRFIFGRQFTWSENDIQHASLLLENDSISDVISVNTLNFDIVDKEDKYNLANDGGLHKYFQKRQEAYAYEYLYNYVEKKPVDFDPEDYYKLQDGVFVQGNEYDTWEDYPEWYSGGRIYLGKYFLKSFKVANGIASMECVSYIGLLDDVQYIRGDIYNGALAGDILEDIFEVANIEEYTIDTVTANTPVYGTLKPMSCREAIREVLFACNSTVDTFADKDMEVHKTNAVLSGTLTRNMKISTSIEKQDYIYQVDMKYYTYTIDTNNSTIINAEEYPAGTHIVTFDAPYGNLALTSSGTAITITESGKYYCKFTLDTTKTITLTGKKYNETKNTISTHLDTMQVGETAVTNEYNTTLCNASMAFARAKDILKYLQNRLKITVQYIANEIELEGRRWVENPSTTYKDFIGWYTSRDIDLTGGFIDTADLMGYYYSEYGLSHVGSSTVTGSVNELYSGSTIGLM